MGLPEKPAYQRACSYYLLVIWTGNWDSHMSPVRTGKLSAININTYVLEYGMFPDVWLLGTEPIAGTLGLSEPSGELDDQH
jgi:hypothetical protein